MDPQSLPPPSVASFLKNGDPYPPAAVAPAAAAAATTAPPASMSADEQARVFAWAQGEAQKNAAKVQSTSAAPVFEKLQTTLSRIAVATEAAEDFTDPNEARERRHRIDNFIENNGVPPKYRTAAFNGFASVPAEVRIAYQEASQDVRQVLYHPGIIVLMGPRGVGKTFLACALVNEFCRQARHAVYAEAMDYFLRLDEAINARGSALAVETKFLRPELLVLDAMEDRADTAAKDRMLTRLINKRYAGNLCTVLITNETSDKFIERVGPSVADRIRDDGQVIVCEWKSLRGRISEPEPEQ